MASPMWLITYDIAKAKRWRKLYTLLKGYGVSVQYSVFECRLSARQQKKLMAEINAIVCAEEDRVSCYPICGQCDARVKIIGQAKRAEAIPDVWIFSSVEGAGFI